MNKIILAILCSISAFSVAAQQKNDTFTVYFALNELTLNADATRTLDSLTHSGLMSTGQKIQLYGYCDYLGTDEHNAMVSLTRAKNVRSYFAKTGISAKNMTVCVGKGKIVKPPKTEHVGYAEDRKVVIVIIPKKEKINLDKVKKNETIALKNLFFEAGQHLFKPPSMHELEVLHEFLMKHPKVKIQIEGHVCCPSEHSDGYDFISKDYNLSVNRAKAVYDYLVEKGIDASRLKYIGMGTKAPLVKEEKTPADEDMNRRVEIRITEK